MQLGRLAELGGSTSSTPMLPGTMNTRRVLSSLQSPRGVLTAASASPLDTYTATKLGGNRGYGPADYTIPPVVPENNTSAQGFATISTMPAMFRPTQDLATVTGMPAFRPTQDGAIVGTMPAVLCSTGVTQVSTAVHQEPTLILQSGPVLQSAVLTATSSSAPAPAVSTLGVFRKQSPPTPLQDETDRFLDLITRADDQDPLMKEGRGGTPQALMKRAASGVAKDSDGCAKKPRVENQGATGKKTEQSVERGATDKVESQELASILKAMESSNARWWKPWKKIHGPLRTRSV